MKPGKLAVTASLAAVICYLSAVPAYGHGGGGGGFSGGGGGGHGGSSGGGGGHGAASAGRGGPSGVRGSPGMRGYPGVYGSNVRTLGPYVPGSSLRSSSVRPTGTGVHQTGTNGRLSTAHAPTHQGVNRTNPNGSRTSVGNRPVNGNRQTHTGNGKRSRIANHEGLDPQTQQRLRNWQGPRADLNTARQRHHDWCHGHHGHDWWHHHCDVIIFVDWGWWGWWDGWWFPAWGYDPYYSEYAYDGPIYGYNGLPPDDAVANVQQELQRLGYFTYAVDGKLGPLTQNAINRYQRDHRLPITGTIDPATVSSLGLAY